MIRLENAIEIARDRDKENARANVQPGLRAGAEASTGVVQHRKLVPESSVSTSTAACQALTELGQARSG